MDPLTGAMTFATLIGLVCNWRQERSAADEDRFKSFMTWLEIHQHNDLKERIHGSDELTRGLHELLAQDLASISSQLEIIAGSIAAVGSRLDALAPLVKGSGSFTDALSTQACEILKLLASDPGAGRLTYIRQSGNGTLGAVIFMIIPAGIQFGIDQPKFVDDDLSQLTHLGFISHSGFTDRRMPIYSLTRAGDRFAATLPEVVLRRAGDPGES